MVGLMNCLCGILSEIINWEIKGTEIYQVSNINPIKFFWLIISCFKTIVAFSYQTAWEIKKERASL